MREVLEPMNGDDDDDDEEEEDILELKKAI